MRRSMNKICSYFSRRWLDQCTWAHDSGPARARRCGKNETLWVGQNLGAIIHPTFSPERKYVEIINLWYDEVSCST